MPKHARRPDKGPPCFNKLTIEITAALYGRRRAIEMLIANYDRRGFA